MPSKMKNIGLMALFFFCGCSQVTSHKVLSTIFDGVPSLPPPEQLCKEYTEQALSKMRHDIGGTSDSRNPQQESSASSSHKPYAEKKCDSCHDKTAQSGFVTKSKQELCLICHKNLVVGAFVHGPAAVGDCLACHDPHTAQNPSLLKVPTTGVCNVCHREKRQAASLHEIVAGRGIICANCHNPHSGNVRFFLK